MHTYLSLTGEKLPVQQVDFTDTHVPQLPENKQVGGFTYKVTVTKQGNATMVTRFSRPLTKFWMRKSNARGARTPKPPEEYERRADNITRARRMSKLAIAGSLPTRKIAGKRNIFMTHTLAPDKEDMKANFYWFRKEHAKTIRRLKKLNPYIIIITAYEWQDGTRIDRTKFPDKEARMAIHAHSIVIGLPYLPGNLDEELHKLWPHGNTDIVEIGTSWDDRARVIHYMTDYITSDALTAKIKHARLYYTNKGLPARHRYQHPRHTQQVMNQLLGERWLKLWIGAWVNMYTPTPEEVAAGRSPIKLQSEMWLAPP